MKKLTDERGRAPVARIVLVAALTLLLGLVVAGTGFAGGGKGHRVKVTPKHMHGWAFAQEAPIGSGMMVRGPGHPPRGKGSAQLMVDSNGREILYKAAYQGTYLRDFTTLTYWTYRQEGLPPLAISLQFNIDRNLNDTDETYQGRVVYEPYYSHIVLDHTWQMWNTQDNAPPGNWWLSRPPVGGLCIQAAPCTWAQLLANYPNIGVHRTFGAVLLKAGGPWPPSFLGNTDALTIGVRGGRTTTYDFEPNKGHGH